MISFEDALFGKLMLEAGVSGALDKELEQALAEEDPLRDVTLELAYSRDDPNAQLKALNKYLSAVPMDRIDTDSVAERVIGFFREKYENDPKDLKALSDMMCRTAVNSGLREENALINHLDAVGDYYSLVEDGILPENHFRESLEALLYERVFVSPWNGLAVKPGIFARLKRLLTKHKSDPE